MKKKIIIAVTIVIVIIVGLFVIINSIPEKTKIEDIKTVHGIKFYNAKIVKKNKKYIFYVTLSTDQEVVADNFDADIKDKNGKSLAVLKGYIGNMKKEDIINVEIETTIDLKKAYQITYTVNAK